MEVAFSEHDGAVLELVPSPGDPEWWLVGAFLAIICCHELAVRLQRRSFRRFASGLVRDARSAALAHIWSAASPDRDERDREEALARAIDDSARLEAGLERALLHMAKDGPFLVGACVVLLAIDVRLGLVLLAGGVAVIALGLFAAAQASSDSLSIRGEDGRLTGTRHRYLATQRGGSSEIELASHRGSPRPRSTRIETVLLAAVHGTLAATGAAVLLLGLYLVRTDGLPPGDVFIALAYLLALHYPAVRFSRELGRSGALLESAERLADQSSGASRSSGTCKEPRRISSSSSGGR